MGRVEMTKQNILIVTGSALCILFWAAILATVILVPLGAGS